MHSAPWFVVPPRLRFPDLDIPRRVSAGLTVRGFVILLFAAALVAGPGLKEFDVVASVLGYSLVATILVLLALTLINAKILKRELDLSVRPPLQPAASVATERMESELPQLFGVTLSPVRLLPLLVLRIQALFDHPGVAVPAHLLVHSFPNGTNLIYQLVFPHRGRWTLSQVGVRLGDRFGLTAVEWIVNMSLTPLAVYPPKAEPAQEPIISSYYRPGDAQHDVRERTGDPFDLRRYNPSEGAHRIVWKIYAKSGELVSRHPEASMIPEGQVAGFCLARTTDEDLCARTVAYLRRLEEFELEIAFETHGGEQEEPASTSELAEELLVTRVWGTVNESPEMIRRRFTAFITNQQRRASGGTLDRVLIFLSAARFSSAAEVSFVASLGDDLDRAGIHPVFLCYAAHGAESVSSPNRRPPTWLKRHLLPLLLHSDQGSQPQEGEFANEFLRVCAARNWNIIV